MKTTAKMIEELLEASNTQFGLRGLGARVAAAHKRHLANPTRLTIDQKQVLLATLPHDDLAARVIRRQLSQASKGFA